MCKSTGLVMQDCAQYLHMSERKSSPKLLERGLISEESEDQSFSDGHFLQHQVMDMQGAPVVPDVAQGQTPVVLQGLEWTGHEVEVGNRALQLGELERPYPTKEYYSHHGRDAKLLQIRANLKEKGKCTDTMLGVLSTFGKMMINKLPESGRATLVAEEEMEPGHMLDKVRLKCKDLEFMRQNIMKDIALSEKVCKDSAVKLEAWLQQNLQEISMSLLGTNGMRN